MRYPAVEMAQPAGRMRCVEIVVLCTTGQMRQIPGQVRYAAMELMQTSGRLPAVGPVVSRQPAETIRFPLRVLRPAVDMAASSGRPAPRPAAETQASAEMSPLPERPAGIAG